MRIGIDASRYNNEFATGVEWYGKQIIDHMLPLFRKDDNLILYSRFPLEDLGFEAVENRVIYSKRFWTLKALSKEIKESPPDALFIPSHVLPLKLAERSIITVHDLAFKRFKRVYSFVQYNYLNWSTKVAVKKAVKIIVPSEVTKQDLIEFYNCDEGKIEVVHHGFTAPAQVDEESIRQNSVIFKHFNISKDSKYLLFVGRLETKKNLVLLVEAFAKFSELHPEYRLILAGKRGVGFNKILRKVRELEMGEKIVMPGYINEEEKFVLYKNCQFFVFPSLYEGFGLPVLEAFYHEVPVVCSDVSSLPEVAGEAAEYVDPQKSDSIFAGMEKLANSKERCRELSELGKERLKNFSWEVAAEKTVKIIYG